MPIKQRCLRCGQVPGSELGITYREQLHFVAVLEPIVMSRAGNARFASPLVGTTADLRI